METPPKELSSEVQVCQFRERAVKIGNFGGRHSLGGLGYCIEFYLIFLVFFLDIFTTEITPVTSSSSDIMNPLPTSEEKYMNVFLPLLVTKRLQSNCFVKIQHLYK